jgi:membrane-associated phospholipid phosphatase
MNLRSETFIRFWNVISSSHAYVYFISLAIYFADVSIYNIGGFIGLLLATFIPDGLKKHVFTSNKRPADACDCNVWANNGPQGGKPGMPSGHSSVASFILVYYGKLVYDKLKDWKQQIAFLLLGSFYILTIMARYLKRCHTIEQITAGSLLGAIIAFVCIKVFNQDKTRKIGT